MRHAIVLAIAALAAPLAASAYTTYSRTVIIDDRPVIHSTLHVCDARNAELWDRKALLDQDKRDADREREAIARAKARLDGELAQLDRANTGAVRDYNARSNALNARVDDYNRRVADMNGAVALLNADSAEMVDYCNRIYSVSR